MLEFLTYRHQQSHLFLMFLAPTCWLKGAPLINFCQTCPLFREPLQRSSKHYDLLWQMFSQVFLVQPFSSQAECQENTHNYTVRMSFTELEASSFLIIIIWVGCMSYSQCSQWSALSGLLILNDNLTNGDKIRRSVSHWWNAIARYLSRHQAFKTISEMIRTMQPHLC